MSETGIKSTPFWWEAAPVRHTDVQPISPDIDVLIVGAGYTGLSAAITLARAGRRVEVFDRQRPGEGASSRNGGITSGNLRPGPSQLSRKFGEERARAILEEGKAAREDLYRFIREERVDCDFALSGRFVGALGPSQYEALARDAEYLSRTLGVEAFAVSPRDQQKYIGTEFYHGGNVRMDIGGLHPGKLHAEMMRLALAAGVVVHGETAVTGIKSDGDRHVVQTDRGIVRTRNVIVATNGYADAADKWLRRRIVPVRSRIIATEELEPAMMKRLMPGLMMCGDTRKLSYYYRPSPDGKRILFGGRDGTIAGEPTWPSDHLREQLALIFPELSGTAISHSWYGYVGMNRDMVPRIFTRKGKRYATGYCGSGVVWARWAGQKVALQILAEESGKSAFDFRPPKAVPFFRGHAWFMPVVYGWLSMKDRSAMRSRQ